MRESEEIRGSEVRERGSERTREKIFNEREEENRKREEGRMRGRRRGRKGERKSGGGVDIQRETGTERHSHTQIDGEK